MFQTNPTGRDNRPARKLTGIHSLWGLWTFDFDESGGIMRAVPDRSALFHANVTPLLMPPACANCLSLATIQFSKPQGILDITATLMNPTKLTGYDVRGIIMFDTSYITVTNPDDYTSLYNTILTKENKSVFRVFKRNLGSKLQARSETFKGDRFPFYSERAFRQG